MKFNRGFFALGRTVGAASGLVFLTLLFSTRGSATVIVTGQTGAFKDLVNGLLKGATVAIDNNGVMTITVTGPLNAFGKLIKQEIESKDPQGNAIKDPNGNPVKITIDAQNGGKYPIGHYSGGGTQIVEIPDVQKYGAPGSGLRTQGAVLIHEMEEVFDSVKDGKANAAAKDGGKDFNANHKGSALAGENAVDEDESSISRTSEVTPTIISKTPNADNTVITVKFKMKATYTSLAGGQKQEIFIDEFGTRTLDLKNHTDTTHVDSQAKEANKPVGGGKFFIQEEPGTDTEQGLYFFDGPSFRSLDEHPLDQPGYVTLDGFGDLYISEQREDAVLILDHNGTPQLTLSFPFSSPQGIAVSSTPTFQSDLPIPVSDTVYVGGGNVIAKYDLNSFTISPFTNPALQNVKGLAIDVNGFLYAASFGNNSVVKLDPVSGELLGVFASTELTGPEGVAVDYFGNVYVASFNNGKVLEFDPNGILMSTFTAGGLLSGPKGIALSPQTPQFSIPGIGPSTYGLFPTTLLVSSFNNDTVFEIDLQTGLVLHSATIHAPVGVAEYETLRALCDANGDEVINSLDINLILAARGQKVTRPGDPRDANGDGVITVTDARACTLVCSKPLCAL